MKALSLAVSLLLLMACRDAPIEPDASSDASEPADATDTAVDVAEAGPRDVGERERDVGVLPDGGPPATGCDTETEFVVPSSDDVPLPASHEPLSGPGGPARSFDESERLEACAHLDGGPMDLDHHNAVFMYDGQLLMPWAHQRGEGAISVFDFDDPCAPVANDHFFHPQMRETHAAGIGRIDGRDYLVTASLRGILIWDVSDLDAVEMISELELPGVTYPNAYARVVMSTSWQAPYIYVGAADNGVFVVDASDPRNPEMVHQLSPEPDMRVGGVHALGTLLVLFPTEGSRTTLYDIGDPVRPRPLSTLLLTDGTRNRLGRPSLATSYFSHLSGDYAYYARHIFGGGLIIYDFSDPRSPRFVGHWGSPDDRVNGGYVFMRNELAYVGLSSQGEVIDVSDPSAPTRLDVVRMTGDLDTMVPVGNVIVVSVDDDAIPDEATSVFPWETAPDSRPAVVNRVVPADGETRVPLVARVGVSFDEPVDFQSVFEGSVRLRELDASGAPIGGVIPADMSGQEGLVNLAPRGRLRPNTTYRVEVPEGGVMDASGNRMGSDFSSTFTTVACDES